MKGRQGIMPGYNAQAMASPIAQSSGSGMLITAADVVSSAADSGQLVPMLEQAEEMIGERVQNSIQDLGRMMDSMILPICPPGTSQGRELLRSTQ